MSVITGELGCVDGIHTVRDWMVNKLAETKQYWASNTKGAPGAKAGNKDWNGRCNAYGATPVKLPTDEFDFIGSVDGAKGVKGAAIVDAVEINWNIEAGELIQYMIEFSGNGALDDADTTAVSDATVPDAPTSVGCKVQIADPAAAPSWSNLAEVRTMRLRITADNKERVSSSTAGLKLRKAGNINLEFSIAVYGDSLDDMPEENDIKCLRFYTEAAKYWEIFWGIFGEAGDFTVDRERAELIGATLNGSFCGFTDVAATPTEGKIVKPDTAVWWPPA